ncbi:family 43 glycosylhydrolase [Kineococcus sp. SYSU DK003]|uniref:family 43 glycosylhydrolase n=1 Tax=Kineococcus sp. SYSU DK003 TaxID=3383124 RepID=UPI003D7CE4E0
MTSRTLNSVIRPGEVWLDTSGQRIHAHGGSLTTTDDGRFVWYGENKERTVAGSAIWHWGVRAYVSDDLVNWEDRGLIIPPVLDDLSSPLHPEQMMDRPHILRDPVSGRYVCWLKVMGQGGMTQTSTVLVADDIFGPYRIVRTGLRPLNMSAGDFDLVIDPSDGKGYYFFERVHSELICADLSADYTDVTGYYSTHFPHPHPPLVREAPAYFRRKGLHYLITSGTSGYLPNPSEVAVAQTYHGPWTMLGDPHPGDETRTSFRSQISSVFKHPGKKDLYIALADRWRPDLTPEQSDRRELYTARFSGAMEHEAFVEALGPALDTAADTSLADYVWLPIRFDGPVPVIEWRDEWSPAEFD